LGQSNAEQEGPYLAAWSGKGRAYKAGRLKSRGAGRESEGVSQVVSKLAGVGEGRHNRRDAPVKGRLARWFGQHARPSRKISVKPYAGKPHVRFEKGLMETGRR